MNNPVIFIELDGRVPKLAIILETKPGKNEFEQHVQSLKNADFVVVYAKTGADVISLMEANSSEDSPIERLTILSHSGPDALYGEGGNNNGLYTNNGITDAADLLLVNSTAGDDYSSEDMDNQINTLRKSGARTIEDVSKSVTNGKAVFAKEAKILLGGCSTAGNKKVSTSSIAAQISTATGKSVIGSQGKSSPSKTDDTKRISDGKWYEFYKTIFTKKNKEQDVTNY